MVKIRNFNGTPIVAMALLMGSASPTLAGSLGRLGDNPYNACSVSLDKSAIKKDMAAMACANALYPDDMGRCVEQVSAKKVEATVALSACRSVRRPLELATCLSDIHKQDEKVVLTDVLEFCRRSLLPERYGHCVVGLKNKPLALTSEEALPTCINASDRPTDIELFKGFEPIDKVPSIRNPMGSPIMPPSFVPTLTPTPTPTPGSANPGSNPNAPSSGTTTPQLF